MTSNERVRVDRSMELLIASNVPILLALTTISVVLPKDMERERVELNLALISFAD